MRNSFKLAAIFAAMDAGLGGGLAAMREMFTPRFRFDREGYTHQRNGRKNRHSCAGSKRPPRHSADIGCGAKQCRKALARHPHGDDSEWRKRMAWQVPTQETPEAAGRRRAAHGFHSCQCRRLAADALAPEQDQGKRA